MFLSSPLSSSSVGCTRECHFLVALATEIKNKKKSPTVLLGVRHPNVSPFDCDVCTLRCMCVSVFVHVRSCLSD